MRCTALISVRPPVAWDYEFGTSRVRFTRRQTLANEARRRVASRRVSIVVQSPEVVARLQCSLVIASSCKFRVRVVLVFESSLSVCELSAAPQERTVGGSGTQVLRATREAVCTLVCD